MNTSEERPMPPPDACDVCGRRIAQHRCPRCDLQLCDTHRDCPECDGCVFDPEPYDHEEAKRHAQD